MTINIAPEDRPYFRYLWQGPDDSRPRCSQMRRVTWGAAPSGFLLAAVLREHFRRIDPASEFSLGDSFYFDDMLRSFDSESEAISFMDRLIPWMDSANMQLGEWKSNSAAVLCHLSRTSSTSTLSGLVETGLLNVLGIAWAPAEDSFQIQVPDTLLPSACVGKPTRRHVLRVVASIFDTVGWLIPFTIRGKLIIQRFAGHRSGSPLRINRLYGQPGRTIVGYELHVFGDASEKAYAAVAYLKTLYADGGSSCALLMSKSRIAPKDKATLPRLELMASVLAARLRVFVLDRLDISVNSVFHYTDSVVAYFWCTAEEPSRWRTFVCNRVREIQRLTSPSEWRHVIGQENIADIASRWVPVEELVSNPAWWYGPFWLLEPEDDRPVKRPRPGSDKSESVSSELRLVVTSVVATAAIIDLQRFSSLEKAVRVMADILYFIQRCRKQPCASDALLRRRADKSTQQQHFSTEINATLANENPTRSSQLNSFRLHVDNDGLLRARTRLTQGPHFTFDEANPIIIPSPSRLATSIVLYYHRLNAHLGVSAVLNAIRRRFWIVRGRQVIKNILRGCVVCKRSHGPSADQIQAPLPAERVSLVAPFAVTAVDFCGPFYTRSREGTCKNYIALFTCASIRAVHLELVPDISTLQTHLALRRFLAEYPACGFFVSDNGKSFVRAAADIKQLFSSFCKVEVRELLAQHQIEWNFNCPRAPWRGGFFERLVGVTKAALRNTLGRSLISAEELYTVLRELSAVINNRPLSYTYSDINEPRAITPFQLLRGGPASEPLCSLTPLDNLGPNGSGIACGRRGA